MMTNHMLALYPDVFKAGAAFMGVPFNCFADAADYPPGQQPVHRREHEPHPAAVGRRGPPGVPRLHRAASAGCSSGTAPPTRSCRTRCCRRTIEQWTNVFGLSQTPTSTDTPQSGWNRRRYADSSGTVEVEAYSIQGAGHSLPSTGMAAYGDRLLRPDQHARPTTPPPGPTTPPPAPTDAPARPHHPAAGTDHAAAGHRRLLGAHRRVNAWNTGLTENITITQHRLDRGQRLVAGVHAARRPDHHLRLERLVLPLLGPGDGAQRLPTTRPSRPAARPPSASRPTTPATPPAQLVHPQRPVLHAHLTGVPRPR